MNLGFGIWDLGFGIRNLGFGIRDLVFGISNLEFWIWDLLFGIQDLELGIWDLDSFCPTDPSDKLGVAQLSKIFLYTF